MTLEAKTIIPIPKACDDTITLDAHARHRRRYMLMSDGGIKFLLHLEKATLLKAGDGLVLEDGRVIKVLCQSEGLYRIRGHSPRHLLSLAWHIGNRHLKAEIREDHILIQPDPVIKDMLEGLGAHIDEVQSPFDPETGAYDHHHDHHHEQDGANG